MNFPRLNPNPIDNLPIAMQGELLRSEVGQLDRQMPLSAVLESRRAYDDMMWDIVGNPYQTFAPNGLRLLSGMSRSGNILHVGLNGDKEYDIQELDLSSGEQQTWHIKEIHRGPSAGVLDLELIIGRNALTLLDDPPTKLSFIEPSASDGQIIEKGEGTMYSRSLLKNLYSVVRAFDEKYGHLGVVYAPEVPQEVPAAIIGM
jgi:hypothetical protein